MIHLDTNFIVGLEDEDSPESAQMKRWLQDNQEVGVSCVAWAEYLCGPVAHARMLEALLPTPVAFDREDAAAAAVLFNATGRRSKSLRDCMIAAVAIRAKAKLATANLKDFRRFEPLGLRIAE